MSIHARIGALASASVLVLLASRASAEDAAASSHRDRVALGGDVHVRRGERVRDAVAMGGDLTVEGVVEGSAVAMGGDVRVSGSGEVLGDVTAMGGALVVEPGGHVAGARVELGGPGPVARGPRATSLPAVPGGRAADRWFWASAARSAAQWALLFVLGLVLLGFAPERLDGTTHAVLRRPLPALVTGVLVAVGAVTATLVLVLTVLGIPAAIVLALAAVAGGYLGLAVSARAIGGVLPFAVLRDRPAGQLAAGVASLFVASFVPGLGDAIVVGSALVGLGAVWLTRFGRTGSACTAAGSGPYRSAIGV
ncbi:MAG: hypothetical protein IT379_19525 [Deltaproteobacteria bacterium]|nr:hypothetical protein [Deltaproteobacteria bacterium]